MKAIIEKITILKTEVFGLGLNDKTGCLHYHSPLDIVAIKFKCCNRYYACYQCHQEAEDHVSERWSFQDLHTKAVLCGHCGVELSIYQYLSCGSKCLYCRAKFNPKCKEHLSLYFTSFLSV